jgi:hypothetical protein
METALSERDRAIRLAEQIYQDKKAQGMDMSMGPCLSEEVIPDWCVDIAHSPRQEIDNRPENRCESYRMGRVHHFVELDPEGHLIRAG